VKLRKSEILRLHGSTKEGGKKQDARSKGEEVKLGDGGSSRKRGSPYRGTKKSINSTLKELPSYLCVVCIQRRGGASTPMPKSGGKTFPEVKRKSLRKKKEKKNLQSL